MKKTLVMFSILFCLTALSSCSELQLDAAQNQPLVSEASSQNSPAPTPSQTELRETVKTDPSDLLPFINQEGKYGYMDNQGNVIIKPMFDGAMRFTEGFAVVWKEKKAGYIDSTGKTVIPLEYDYAYPASDGIATTVINKPEGNTTVYLDIGGKELLRVAYYYAKPFHEGLAAVMETQSSKWRYIDRTGKFVLNPQYGGGDFHEGMAHFSGTGENGMGYIDKTGKVVLEGFYYAGDFSEGLAAARKDGKWGYINKDGEFVLIFDKLSQHDTLFNFSDGMAQVMVNALIGVIDKNGKYVVEPKRIDIGGVFEGLVMILDGFEKGITTFHYETLDGKIVEPKE